MLSRVTQRLHLKDEPFKVISAASHQQKDELWSELKTIEPLIQHTDRSRSIIDQRPGLKRFLEHCCCSRTYMFSVKKCFKPGCSMCKPPRLPQNLWQNVHHLPDPVPQNNGEHYKSFSEFYGSKTTEEHCPSLSAKAAKGHGISFSPTAQTAKNVAEVIVCSECTKPRVLYCAYKLREEEYHTLKAKLEDVSYSCDTSIQELLCGEPHNDDESAADETGRGGASKPGRGTRKVRSLKQDVYVRRSLQCNNPIEVPYYSSNVFRDRCVHCGSFQDFVNDSEVYPTCNACKSKVKIYKRKRKGGAAGSSAKKVKG